MEGRTGILNYIKINDYTRNINRITKNRFMLSGGLQHSIYV